MKKDDKKLIIFSVIVMALSGIALQVLDEYFKIDTAYGQRANPWIDDVKFVHNLFNFIFIFAVGKIFNGHIVHGLRLKKRKHRLTGFSIFTSTIGLVISGTLLLYVSDDDYLSNLMSTHWYLGAFFSISFIFHQLALLIDNKRLL